MIREPCFHRTLLEHFEIGAGEAKIDAGILAHVALAGGLPSPGRAVVAEILWHLSLPVDPPVPTPAQPIKADISKCSCPRTSPVLLTGASLTLDRPFVRPYRALSRVSQRTVDGVV